MNVKQVAKGIVDNAFALAEIQVRMVKAEHGNQVIELCREEINLFYKGDERVKSEVRLLLQKKLKRKINRELDIYDQAF